MALISFGRRVAVVGASDTPTPPLSHAEPPENGIVKILRGAVPYVAAMDYLVVIAIIIKLCLTLFLSKDVLGWSTQLWWIMSLEIFPTGGVLLTGTVAAGLITARLSSLESDQTDIPTIKDKGAQKERKLHLDNQISICNSQRIQSVALIVGYVIVASAPSVLGIDIASSGGRGVLLGLIVAEMMVPLLNMRTFTIVEASMLKIDVIRNVMYQASHAAQNVLAGIGERASNEKLSRQDKSALRRGRKGDIDGMLSTRSEVNVNLIDGEKYSSLRSIITGVKDGDPLSEEQALRYKKALAISRKYKSSEDEAIRRHFTRGAHNQSLVSQEMGGRIARDVAAVRSRKRPTKVVYNEKSLFSQENTEEATEATNNANTPSTPDGTPAE